MTNYWPALRTGGLFLASLTLVPFSASAQTSSAQTPNAATASPRNSVSRVEVNGDANQATVRVEGTGEGAELNYQVSRLSDPPRVVVDLSDAHLAIGRNAISSAFEPVHGVRLGQYRPDQVRVVIDLTRQADYAIAKSGHGLTVTFVNAPPAAKSGVAADASPFAAAPAKRLVAADKKSGETSHALPLPALLTQADAAMASPAQQLNPRAAIDQASQAAQSCCTAGLLQRNSRKRPVKPSRIMAASPFPSTLRMST